MARKDIITTDDTLPIFLVDHVDGLVQQVPSRLSKAAVSIIVAIGVGVAIALRLVGPEKIFAEVNASLIDVPSLSVMPIKRHQRLKQPPLSLKFRNRLQVRRQPATRFPPLSMSSIEAKQKSATPSLEPC